MVVKDRNSEVKRLAPTNISRLTFGVRYDPQYGVMDRIGSVIDAVLRSKGTPFGPETFPLSQASPNEHLLINPDVGNLLRVTHQDTILQLPIDTRNLDRIPEIATDFEEFVLRRLREIGKLCNISRYGVVLHLNNISDSLRDRPISHYLSSEFPRADSLVMRFSRRLPTDEALVKKQVDDYRNVIYTLREEEKEVSISIDYQEYFRPALDIGDWGNRPFPRFVERGLAYFEGEFQKWFERLVGKSEVA